MASNVNENVLIEPLKTGSLRARVVETLREAIFSGKLKPGDPIREAHMARALQVSQPTVREALLQLEHAGLVVRNPQRDTTVTRLSAADIRERAAIRALLEAEAAVQAVERMSEEDFAALHTRLDAIHDALARDSYTDFVAADLEFHRHIWQLSGNRMLYKLLDLTTVPLFAFLSIRRSRVLKDLVHTVRPHDPIMAAMRARDAGQIRDALRQHIEGSYHSFSEGLTPEQQSAITTP